MAQEEKEQQKAEKFDSHEVEDLIPVPANHLEKSMDELDYHLQTAERIHESFRASADVDGSHITLNQGKITVDVDTNPYIWIIDKVECKVGKSPSGKKMNLKGLLNASKQNGEKIFEKESFTYYLFQDVTKKSGGIRLLLVFDQIESGKISKEQTDASKAFLTQLKRMTETRCTDIISTAAAAIE